jgi:anthranilate/para-aminobenzoate synthase component I
VREISLPVEELLRALLNLDSSRRVSILDSGGRRGAEARLLIAGFDPFEIVEAYGDEVRVSSALGQSVTKGADVLAILDERLERFRTRPSSPQGLTPPGACVASFSYDLARRFEHLSRLLETDSNEEPTAVLAFYDTLVVHDYLLGETKIVSCAGQKRVREFYD